MAPNDGGKEYLELKEKTFVGEIFRCCSKKHQVFKFVLKYKFV
jgi:hypothetical protein